MPQLIALAGGVEIDRVLLTKNRTTVGRQPHNDIVLNNMVVSSEHCVFDIHGIADVYVEDLGSTNGTYINGHMVKTPQLLRDGDLLTIGTFQIHFLATSQRQEFAHTQSTEPISLEALGLPGTAGSRRASLRVLTGSDAGQQMPVAKAVTTFGQPGVAVVAISHRRDGYYVAHLDGEVPSTLNGLPIGRGATPLAHQDVLNLAGAEMEFVLT